MSVENVARQNEKQKIEMRPKNENANTFTLKRYIYTHLYLQKLLGIVQKHDMRRVETDSEEKESHEKRSTEKVVQSQMKGKLKKSQVHPDASSIFRICTRLDGRTGGAACVAQESQPRHSLPVSTVRRSYTSGDEAPP